MKTFISYFSIPLFILLFSFPESVQAQCNPTIANSNGPFIYVQDSFCELDFTTTYDGFFEALDCPNGSYLEHSLDGGITWSSSTPIYNQNNSVTYQFRCVCNTDPNDISPIKVVTTSPSPCGTCSGYIDIESQSVCSADNTGNGMMSITHTVNSCELKPDMYHDVPGLEVLYEYYFVFYINGNFVNGLFFEDCQSYFTVEYPINNTCAPIDYTYEVNAYIVGDDGWNFVSTNDPNCLTYTFTITINSSNPCATNPCISHICPPDYVNGSNGGLSGNENGVADYETNGPIESIQTIASTAQVDYDSRISVTLNEGFSVEAGAIFNAFTDGCDGGNGGVNLNGDQPNSLQNTDTNSTIEEKKQIYKSWKWYMQVLKESVINEIEMLK